MIHEQSCCFANLNLLLFLPFSLTSPSSLLKLPIDPLSRKRLVTLLVSCHSLTDRLQNRASHHAQNKQICILASHYVCKLLVEELKKRELLGFSPPPPRRYRNKSETQAGAKRGKRSFLLPSNDIMICSYTSHSFE